MGVLAGLARGLDRAQLAMVETIERAFTAAGYSLPVVAAAIVNARAESNLQPRASGDLAGALARFLAREHHRAAEDTPCAPPSTPAPSTP